MSFSGGKPLTIGIIGAGQLGRMLALAGYPLGLRFEMLDPNPAACGGQVAPLTVAPFDDRQALTELARRVDLVTYEFENVPVAALEILADHTEVLPGPAVLQTAQDRLREKECFGKLEIPTPAFRPVDSLEQLQAAVAEVGLPAVLKTRRLGYDGKGQMVLRQPEDLAAAWESLGGQALILEAFVPFQREVSLVAARGRDGEMVCYPLAENTHRQGILHLSLAREADPMQALAEDYTRRVMEHFAYVGVLAFEFFQLEEDLVANEIAPRVHNSGHWTIEGAETSQFANHLRAILGWPLGSPDLVGPAAMLNFIGELPDCRALLGYPGLHLHAYGKTGAPGRKVGHATLRLPTREKLAATLRELTVGLAPKKYLQGAVETILVAEDDPVIRQMTTSVLQRFGYQVIEAVDGADAVARFKEHGEQIDLLLFDLIMPKLNGKEAYDAIAAIKPDVRCLFASGYAPDLLRQKVSLDPQTPLLYKPMSINNLLGKVRQVLDQKG